MRESRPPAGPEAPREAERPRAPSGTGVGDPSPRSEDEAPPILGSWSRLYLLVAGTLAALVILFYLFTKTFE